MVFGWTRGLAMFYMTLITMRMMKGRTVSGEVRGIQPSFFQALVNYSKESTSLMVMLFRMAIKIILKNSSIVVTKMLSVMKYAIVEENWAIWIFIKLFWRCWGFLWASVHNFQLFGERRRGGGHWIRPQLHRCDWLDISNQSMRCKYIYFSDDRIDNVFYNQSNKRKATSPQT